MSRSWITARSIGKPDSVAAPDDGVLVETGMGHARGHEPRPVTEAGGHCPDRPVRDASEGADGRARPQLDLPGPAVLREPVGAVEVSGIRGHPPDGHEVITLGHDVDHGLDALAHEVTPSERNRVPVRAVLRDPDRGI